MPEYNDYQLDLTEIEINSALKKMHYMRRGTVTIEASGDSIIESTTVTTDIIRSSSRIMLQLKSENTLDPRFGVVPVVSNVTTTSFKINLVAPKNNDGQHLFKVEAGTYTVDYIII